MSVTIKINDRKIIKVGNSYGVLIPLSYITNDLLSLKAEYTLFLQKKVGGGGKNVKN